MSLSLPLRTAPTAAPTSPRRARRRRRTAVTAVATAAALGLLGTGAALAAAPGATAGPRPDGTATIPMGYRVTPAGNQVQLGDLPLTSALSPDGRTLVVVNAGQGTQSVQVVDTRTGQVVQTIPYVSTPTAIRSVYGGAVFSPDGRRLFVSGGGQNVVHTYDVALGRLTETAPLTAPPTTAPDGSTLNPFPAGLAITPDGARLVVTDQLADAVTVVDLATGALASTPVGHRPYGVTLSADGARAYVANQGAQSVSVVDIAGAKPVVRGEVAVGTHPGRSVLSADGATLYVADGDSDSISVLDTATDAVTRTLSLAPYRGAAVGSNPVRAGPVPRREDAVRGQLRQQRRRRARPGAPRRQPGGGHGAHRLVPHLRARGRRGAVGHQRQGPGRRSQRRPRPAEPDRPRPDPGGPVLRLDDPRHPVGGAPARRRAARGVLAAGGGRRRVRRAHQGAPAPRAPPPRCRGGSATPAPSST